MNKKFVSGVRITNFVIFTDTAKGNRIDVHVYANDSDTAIKEVIDMYLDARQKAKDNEITVDPLEKQ